MTKRGGRPAGHAHGLSEAVATRDIMLIRIDHETVYKYDSPAHYTIQSLKLTPRDHAGQSVRSWRIDCDETLPPPFVDGFGNWTHTLVVDRPHETVRIRVRGLVETTDRHGIVADSFEPFPLAAYLRETELTAVDDRIRSLALDSARSEDSLDRMHDLMQAIRGAVDYRVGATHVETTAAAALDHGYGVCQDHAHLFIACCRVLDVPARYVSGYLCTGADGTVADRSHDAAHAWAEAHVRDLGWVGFDVANEICPTGTHVRVAVGLDYCEAAPVRGLRRGGGDETLDVSVRVVQEQTKAQAQTQTQN